MSEPTRKAIETLERKLRDYCWALYSGAIRYVAIDGTNHRAEVTLCPPAMAVTHNGDRIDDLMQDPTHRKFTDAVNNERLDGTLRYEFDGSNLFLLDAPGGPEDPARADPTLGSPSNELHQEHEAQYGKLQRRRRTDTE